MSPLSDVRRHAAGIALALSLAGCAGMQNSNLGAVANALIESAPTGAGADTRTNLTGGSAHSSATKDKGRTAAQTRKDKDKDKDKGKDTASPERLSAAQAAKQVSTGPQASPDEIKAMLIRADPNACSATSDASFADTFLTYGKLFAGITGDLVNSRLQGGELALQAKLDEIKPALRELARNTNWMPPSVERLLGEQVVAYNKLEDYKPARRQRKLIDETLQPIFDEFSRYAREDLKSDFQFEMRLFQSPETAPQMIAGGILLVPSGMINALEAMPQPEPVVAFLFSHEFSHALRRHKTKKLQMSLVDSMMLAGEFRKIFDTQASGANAVKGNFIEMFKFTSGNVGSLIKQTCKAKSWLPLMEQGQEFEADVCGALLLQHLGDARKKVYRPVDGYLAYMKSGLSQAAEAGKSTPGKAATGFDRCFITADHPPAADRLQNLQSYSMALDQKRGSGGSDLVPFDNRTGGLQGGAPAAGRGKKARQ